MSQSLLLTLGLLAAGSAVAQTAITTLQILAQSLSPACLDYRVVGVCFWLVCSPYGCQVTTTPKICHNLPDVVVSVHSRPEQNPWGEMTALSAAATAAGSAQLGMPLDGGVRTEGNTTRQKENKGMFTRDVSVIGNPMIGATNLFGVGYLCHSNATEFGNLTWDISAL